MDPCVELNAVYRGRNGHIYNQQHHPSPLCIFSRDYTFDCDHTIFSSTASFLIVLVVPSIGQFELFFIHRCVIIHRFKLFLSLPTLHNGQCFVLFYFYLFFELCLSICALNLFFFFSCFVPVRLSLFYVSFTYTYKRIIYAMTIHIFHDPSRINGLRTKSLVHRIIIISVAFIVY